MTACSGRRDFVPCGCQKREQSAYVSTRTIWRLLGNSYKQQKRSSNWLHSSNFRGVPRQPRPFAASLPVCTPGAVCCGWPLTPGQAEEEEGADWKVWVAFSGLGKREPSGVAITAPRPTRNWWVDLLDWTVRVVAREGAMAGTRGRGWASTHTHAHVQHRTMSPCVRERVFFASLEYACHAHLFSPGPTREGEERARGRKRERERGRERGKATRQPGKDASFVVEVDATRPVAPRCSLPRRS